MNKNVMFYLNGKPLTDIPMIQDGNGVYYINRSTGGYCMPKLTDWKVFNKKGCSRYTNGSHSDPRYIRQQAIDLLAYANTPIVASHDFYRIASSPYYGSYTVGWCNGKKIFLVHTYKWNMKSVIKAGEIIAYISPPSYMWNGKRIFVNRGSHLHIYAERGNIWNILVNYRRNMAKYREGTFITPISAINIRREPTIKSQAVVIPHGTIGRILGNTVRTADGYEWQYAEFFLPDRLVWGWIAVKFVKKTNTSPIESYSKQIKSLQDSNNQLSSQVRDLQKKLDSANTIINEKIKKLEDLNKKLTEDLQEARDQLEQLQNQDAIKLYNILQNIVRNAK